MPRPGGAAEHVLKTLDVDESAKARRVDLRVVRREYEIDAFLAADFQVLLQLSRIARQVLTRSKLRRVDKDGHNNETGFRAGSADQAHVPVVQRPHRWHQAHGKAALPRSRHPLANRFDSRDDARLHVVPLTRVFSKSSSR